MMVQNSSFSQELSRVTAAGVTAVGPGARGVGRVGAPAAVVPVRAARSCCSRSQRIFTTVVLLSFLSGVKIVLEVLQYLLTTTPFASGL